MQAEQQEMMRREHREQGMRNKFSQREREAATMFPDMVQLSSVASNDDNTILRKHAEINPQPVEIQVLSTVVCDDIFVNNFRIDKLFFQILQDSP